MFEKLIKWSLEEHQDLPWRKNRTLYRTLVSEFMLQQTTVTAVLKHFDRFLEIYPDIESLSVATEEEVLVAWKGLGYYRRAKNLRKAAIDIYVFFEGKIPLNYDDLISISGIGDYTANALLSIGLNNGGYAIDANIERVLSRIFLIDEFKGPKLHQSIKNNMYINDFLQKFQCRRMNEALMDLGRVYCRAKKVSCESCPVINFCKASKEKNPLKFPKEKTKSKDKSYELELLRIIVRHKNDILVYKKHQSKWLSGQWELPTFIVSSQDKKLTQYPSIDETKLSRQINGSIKTIKSSITKYRISNKICEMDLKDFKKWVKTKDSFILKDYDEIMPHLGSTCQKILS